jgi:hypothetical protein
VASSHREGDFSTGVVHGPDLRRRQSR